MMLKDVIGMLGRLLAGGEVTSAFGATKASMVSISSVRCGPSGNDKRARIAPRPSPLPRASPFQATIIAAWFNVAMAAGKNTAAAAIRQ
jgi:hypothetical protein